MRLRLTLIALLLMLSVSAFAQIAAVPQLMNFQGRLTKPDGTPVPDGTHSVRFSLWTAASGGTEKWNQAVNVAVRKGTFAAQLDTSTGAADKFNNSLFLEVKIGTDAALTPRQPLASVAYAMKADSVRDDAITSVSIADGAITAADIASGGFNTLAWLLGGNSGVTSGFLGTTDNQPLVFKTNNQRALQMQYVTNTIDGFTYLGNNLLGGYWLNSITEGVTGAAVFGGIRYSGADYPNRVTDHGGTVSGGAKNQAGNNNADLRDALYATVGGGYDNIATSNYATVGGGFHNRANDPYATVGGGKENEASGNYATVAGGWGCAGFGEGATSGGGFFNRALGNFSTIPGGWYCVTYAPYSFAAGRRAKARHDGAFVWGDSQDADMDSTGANQFLIRASGGVGINTNNPGNATLYVRGGLTNVAICGGTLAPVGAATFESNRPVSAAYHLAMCNNGQDVFYVDGNGRPHGTGGYVNLSDARFKKNVAPIENALDSILHLRGVTYEWDTEKWKERGFPTGRQMGFLAQEVEAVLPELVTKDAKGVKMVSYTDAVPILVEAIKTMKQQKDTEIAELRAKNTALEARLTALEAALHDRK
jgi:hypothetical protein